MRTLPPASVQPLTLVPTPIRGRHVGPWLAAFAWIALAAHAWVVSHGDDPSLARLLLLISAAACFVAIIPTGIHFQQRRARSLLALCLIVGWCLLVIARLVFRG